MEMERGLDTGPVLGEVRLELAVDETGSSLHDRLASAGANLLLEVLEGYGEGLRPTSIPQDDDQATYAAQLRREDGDLDWSQSAQSLDRRIRALHPWPGTRASVVGRDERLKLHPPVGVLAGSHEAEPGTIVATSNEGVDVLAGDGHIVRLGKLQAPGRKALDAGPFLSGYALSPGERLG